MRRLLILALAAVGMAILLAPAAASTLSGPSAGHAVTVVVDFADGRLVTRRVSFDGDSITALAALQATGLPVTTGFGGGAVCQIETTGCPGANCFCNSSAFWTVWTRDGAGWTPATVGPAQLQLHDGQAAGWHWGPYLPPHTLTSRQLVAYAALDWLRRQQTRDGGFSFSPGSAATPSATLDALLAGAAAHARPWTWQTAEGKSPLDYLTGQATGFVSISAASAGKLAAAVAASGRDPRAFAGLDLVARIQAYLNPATGQFGVNNWDQGWSMVGLRAALQPVPATAVARARATQRPDGSWGWTSGVEGDVDSTAFMIQALIAAGEPISSTTLANAVAFLRTRRTPDGGFRSFGGTPSANSTAVAIQALVALDDDPAGAAWTAGGQTPVSALLAYQTLDGSIRAPDDPNIFQGTAQAVPALLGQAFPIPRGPAAADAALDWMRAQQKPDGGFPGFGVDSDTGATLDAILAIASAGAEVGAWRSSAGHSPVDFLATQVVTYTATSVAALGKTIVGMVAANEDPSRFAGLDLGSRLESARDASGLYGTSVTDQAWALLALAALRRSDPSATTWLASRQLAGGGWELGADQAADTNTTALALQALAAHPGSLSAAAVLSATSYLHGQQNSDAGFPYAKPSAWGTDSDANSTAAVVQALVALGEDPAGPAWTTVLTGTGELTPTLRTPVERLLAFQNASGAFRYQDTAAGDNALATYPAVPALLSEPLPVKRIPFRAWLPVIIRK